MAKKPGRKRPTRVKRVRGPVPVRKAARPVKGSGVPSRTRHRSKPVAPSRKVRSGSKRGVSARVSAPRNRPAPVAPLPPKPKHRLSIPSRVKLREAVTLLRKHVHGYEAGDGVDLKEMEFWDSTKRRRIIKRAAKLRELTHTPHDLVKAPTRKARKNLHQFTGQRIRGAKHFIVHKPGDNFTVRVRNGHVDVEGKFPGQVVSRSQYFLFPRKPRYPKELVAMARKLKKDMPPGFYSVLTTAHGDTGEPFERDEILARLNEYLAAYEVDAHGNATGFSEALLGFRFMATTKRGAEVQRDKVDQRRQAQKRYNNLQRLEALKKERAKAKPKKRRRKK